MGKFSGERDSSSGNSGNSGNSDMGSYHYQERNRDNRSVVKGSRHKTKEEPGYRKKHDTELKVIPVNRYVVKLTDDMQRVFAHPIRWNLAKSFIEQNKDEFNPIHISEALGKVSDAMVRNTQDGKKINPDMTEVAYALLESFLRIKHTDYPRELTGSIKTLGWIISELTDNSFAGRPADHRDTISRFRSLIPKYADKWSTCMKFNNDIAPIDYLYALRGFASRLAVLAERREGSHASLNIKIANIVRDTCNELNARFESGFNEHRAEFINCGHHMVGEGFYSRTFLSKLSSHIASPDAAISRSPSDLEWLDLSERIRVVFCASFFGILNQDALAQILVDTEKAIKDGQTEVFSTRLLSALMATCKVHDLKPSETILNLVDQSLTSQKDSALTVDLHYSAILLPILRDDRADPKKIEHQDIDPRKSVSSLELAVSNMLREEPNEALVKISQQVKLHPCVLDFLIDVQVGDQIIQINLETDGYPYHYMFDMEAGDFNTDVRPLGDELRDQYIELFSAAHVLRLSSEALNEMQCKDLHRAIVNFAESVAHSK